MTWCTAFAMHFVPQTGRWHFAHCFSSEVLRLHPEEYDISTFRELCGLVMVLALDGSVLYVQEVVTRRKILNRTILSN